jgi:hypothetical protein
MTADALVRHPREALDLTILAVALRRRDAGRSALLAAVDQARTCLNYERDPQAWRTLTWVCRALTDPDLVATTARGSSTTRCGSRRRLSHPSSAGGAEMPGDPGACTPDGGVAVGHSRHRWSRRRCAPAGSAGT